MKLFEFFSTLDVNLDQTKEKTADEKYEMSLEERDHFKNDLFFYILDHDDIHRKHFHDVAEQIEKNKDSKPSIWLPIVKKGCLEFHNHNNLLSHPKEIFDKEMMEELCNMLDDHYRKDITDGAYKP
jgi:hypothetical protein